MFLFFLFNDAELKGLSALTNQSRIPLQSNCADRLVERTPEPRMMEYYASSGKATLWLFVNEGLSAS